MRKHRGLKARIHNGPKITRTTAHTSTYQRHGGQEYKMGRKLLGLRSIHPHIHTLKEKGFLQIQNKTTIIQIYKTTITLQSRII